MKKKKRKPKPWKWLGSNFLGFVIYEITDFLWQAARLNKEGETVFILTSTRKELKKYIRAIVAAERTGVIR